jgi:hypothetical protein
MSDLVQEDTIERHHLHWHGIHITIEYEPSWSSSMSDAYGCDMAHLGIQSQDRVALPFTDTGYRSEFKPVDFVVEAGGPVAYVRKWLERLAKDPKWIEHVDMARQIELF